MDAMQETDKEPIFEEETEGVAEQQALMDMVDKIAKP
jgi:hypothetical protein